MKISVLRFALMTAADSGPLHLGHIDWHRHEAARRPVQFLHIDDAVAATSFVVKEMLDGVFNVAPRNFISDETARAIAGGPPRPNLPRRMAMFANDVTWRRRRYRSRFEAAAVYLEHPWVASSDRLQAAGWTPAFTSEEAIAAHTTPTLWNRMSRQQRRDLVNASFVTGLIGSITASLAGLVLMSRRRKLTK